MNIEYYTKNVYGNELNYFATPGNTAMWRKLTGKITITTHEMDALCALTGVTFTRVFEPASVGV